MKSHLSLRKCARNLIKHGFEVKIVSMLLAAGERLRNEIYKVASYSIFYGDSLTVHATGIIEELNQSINFIFLTDLFQTFLGKSKLKEGDKD